MPLSLTPDEGKILSRAMAQDSCAETTRPIAKGIVLKIVLAVVLNLSRFLLLFERDNF